MLCCVVLRCIVLCFCVVLLFWFVLCHVGGRQGIGRLNRCLEFKGPQKIVFNSFSLSHNPKNTVLQHGVLWRVVLTPSV